MTTTDQVKKNNKGNIRSMKIAIIVLFVAVIIASGVYILYKTQPGIFGNQTTNDAQEKGFGQGSGGDPAQMTVYNDQAVAAWESGDKEKAKELAQKGLEEGKNLTSAQMKELSDPIETSFNLQTMAGGGGPSQ